MDKGIKLQTYKQRHGHDINGVRPVMIPDESGEWVSRFDAEHIAEQLQRALSRNAELEAASTMREPSALCVKPLCVKLPDEFARIGENLRTQDNRITSHPVFVIFQKEEMVVSEEFDHDRIAWVWECGDGEVEDRTARRLEALHQGCRDTRGYSRYAMKSINRFVTACFTEDGCKDYLRQNGHNLNEPFIYVHSAYRNDEWQVIRNWLMTVGGTDECNDVITCWSCKKSMTALERSSADGFCPHCDVEIDMQDDRAADGTVKGE